MAFMWVRLFAITALFFVTVTLSATSDSGRFEHLTLADGLSQGTAMDIIQDRRGFIWLATQDGLNLYDGHRIVVFKHDPEQPHSISSNMILSLCEDQDGSIWIGIAGTGLDRYDPATGKFENFAYDNPELTRGSVNALLIDLRGRLWVGTPSGLRLFNRENRKLTVYPENSELPEGLSGEYINLIY